MSWRPLTSDGSNGIENTRPGTVARYLKLSPSYEIQHEVFHGEKLEKSGLCMAGGPADGLSKLFILLTKMVLRS